MYNNNCSLFQLIISITIDIITYSAVQTSAQGGASLLVATKCQFRLLTVRGTVAKL